MKYAKLELNKVIQVQPNEEDGFVSVRSGVICGMIFENEEYVSYRCLKLVDGLYSEDVDEELKEATKALIAKFTSVTDDFIQARVNDFNDANGTKFNNVHNAESYSRVDGYTHQAWCGQLFTWNVNVWEAVRTYQKTLTEAPTDEQFQAVLDSVEFN